jgi:hypothetical protein
MRYVNDSSVFGIEKSKGQLEGILACINQTAFGDEVYKSLDEFLNLEFFASIENCRGTIRPLSTSFLASTKNNLLIKLFHLIPF